MLLVLRKKVKALKVKKSAKTKKAAKTKAKPVLKADVKAGKKANMPAKTEEPEFKKPDAAAQLLMKRVAKILSDSFVRQNLIGLGGENALAIVRNFFGNHSDEELAKRLKIKISDVRATLNKLHNEGLVNYIREKDSETGWYSYSWSLNHKRMERWASNQTIKLNTVTGASGEDYYFCPSCGASSITNFESASCIDFRCEKCNRLLEFVDEKRMAELYDKMKP